jgi:hypothetical protein
MLNTGIIDKCRKLYFIKDGLAICEKISREVGFDLLLTRTNLAMHS